MTAAVNELEDGDDEEEEEEAATAPEEQKQRLGMISFCSTRGSLAVTATSCIHLSRYSCVLLEKPDLAKCLKLKTINPGDL